MELVLGVLLLLGLDVAALRWGVDSRKSLPSAEEWLASRGFAWHPWTS